MKPRSRRWGRVWWGLGAVMDGLLGSLWSERPVRVGLVGAEAVVLYQAPGCSCCGQYEAYLRRRGYTV